MNSKRQATSGTFYDSKDSPQIRSMFLGKTKLRENEIVLEARSLRKSSLKICQVRENLVDSRLGRNGSSAEARSILENKSRT